MFGNEHGTFRWPYPKGPVVYCLPSYIYETGDAGQRRLARIACWIFGHSRADGCARRCRRKDMRRRAQRPKYMAPIRGGT